MGRKLYFEMAGGFGASVCGSFSKRRDAAAPFICSRFRLNALAPRFGADQSTTMSISDSEPNCFARSTSCATSME